MRKPTLRRTAAAATFLLIAAFLSAAGRQEDPIRQARELVAANRINDAINLLERTVREDPDRMIEAEALMRSIREIRGEYNVLFELLIDNLVNNPDDITTTLEIIDRMEDLDEFPNRRVLEQVEDARIIAQLAFDRNVVNETMDEARDLLARDEYAEAISLYLSLEPRQRPEFEDRGYGDIFINRVNQAVSNVEAVAIDFIDRLEPYTEAGEAMTRRARENLSVLDQGALPLFIDEARSLVDVLERAESVGQEIAVLKSQVPLQFPDQPVEWYLNFQEMVTRGRSEHRDAEGIAYAVGKLFEEYPRRLVLIAGEEAERELEQGIRRLDEERYETASQRLENAVTATRVLERGEALLLRIFEEDFPLDTIPEQYQSDESHRLITARVQRRSARSLEEYALRRTRLSAIPSLEDAEDRAAADAPSVEDLQQRKDDLAIVVADLRNGRAAWEEDLEVFDRLPGQYITSEAQTLMTQVTARRDTGIEHAVQRERATAIRIAEVRTETVPAVIASAAGELEAVNTLLTGVEEPLEDAESDEDEQAVRIVRYPDESLERLSVLDDQLATTLTATRSTREDLFGELPYVIEGENVQQELLRLAMLEEQLEALQIRAAEAGSTADTLIAEAETNRDQGFQQIANARAAIDRIDMDAARAQWDAARDSFFDSLELREDPGFRQEADQLIAEVGEELLELENVIVVRRVRELLNEAESLYNQDEYVAARDVLLEAQETWEQTNVESNNEIDRLMLLATAAINLDEGRELIATDPLYPVLGNYMSLAREDYNRGMELYDAGREDEANRLFDRSIENLRNVRDVRPLNWQARILELRIVQVRDADRFDEIFASRFNQAVARLDQDGPLQVYSEIEVLAEIDPDFPGIQQQLRELEIALNLRPDPIDQQRIAEARRLYQQAENLSSGSRDQMAVAVSLLEDAVDLNPNNRDARFLLDQLRIQLGGQATAALSTTDEQQYRRAETLFQQGQVLQALAITERLLSNTANQGYPPLVELRRRIGLRLGI